MPLRAGDVWAWPVCLVWTWCALVALRAHHPLASTIGDRAHTVVRFLEGLGHPLTTTGAARAHHGYLFANARATRIKLLVHDGFGVWCAARRLNAGHFAWPREAAS